MGYELIKKIVGKLEHFYLESRFLGLISRYMV